MAKHYARKNANGDVIDVFSDKFKVPGVDDECINSDAPRHAPIVNLKNDDGLYKYKVNNGALVEKTHEEIYTAENSQAILAAHKDARVADLKRYIFDKLIENDADYQNYSDQINAATTQGELDAVTWGK